MQGYEYHINTNMTFQLVISITYYTALYSLYKHRTVKTNLSVCKPWRHLCEWRYSSTFSFPSAVDEGEWLAWHFMFSDFFPKIASLMRRWCKNVVHSERPQMIIWRMRVACWISKATGALSYASTHERMRREICNIIGFPRQPLLGMALYVHCMSCLIVLEKTT